MVLALIAVVCAAAAGWLLPAQRAATGRGPAAAGRGPAATGRRPTAAASGRAAGTGAAGAAPAAGGASATGAAAAVRCALRAGPGRRRDGQDTAAHLQALRQLASLLRAGRPPADAWGLLGSAWERTARRAAQDGGTSAAADIVAACRAVRAGQGMGEAPSRSLGRHAADTGGEWAALWRRVCWCLRLSESTGAALSELLEGMAGQAEAAADRRRALDSAMAGPRATQRLLAWLPAVGVAMAQVLGADPVGVLTGHAVGRVCLVAGLALWWANRVWGRRLVRAAVGSPR